tara:strand:+ start:5055 stop:5207 length:153 start_codon:yes stop_codon:yes gene_type:complete
MVAASILLWDAGCHPPPTPDVCTGEGRWERKEKVNVRGRGEAPKRMLERE